jgi:rod shape-determining protein MreC
MALGADRYESRADTLAFLVCVALSLVAMALPPRVRDPIASGLRRTVLAPFLALQEQSLQLQTSRARFRALEQQRDSAVLAATFLPVLRAENERLRALLGLRARLGTGAVAAEVLHQAEPTSPLTLVISAGSRHGVRPLAPVVSPEGLVGTVASVDATTSVVATWAHPDFRASATAADGSVVGIVGPAGAAGAGGWLMELRGVPYRDSVPPGTVIITAGLGGVLPRGIPVGTVLGVSGEAVGWERSYRVRPAAQPAQVSHVMVLQPGAAHLP